MPKISEKITFHLPTGASMLRWGVYPLAQLLPGCKSTTANAKPGFGDLIPLHILCLTMNVRRILSLRIAENEE